MAAWGLMNQCRMRRDLCKLGMQGRFQVGKEGMALMARWSMMKS